MKLVEHSLKYGVTVAVGVIMIIMFGSMSLLRIPVQLTPEVSQPELSIRTIWPGSSPEEVEREIIDEQEQHLKSIVGLVEMRSVASTGRGEIYLAFKTGSNLQDTLVRTSNKLQQVTSYPEDVDEPIIKTVNVSDSEVRGGDFDEGKRRYIVRTTGEFQSTEDIENTIIKHVGMTPVFVKDVAEVTVGYDELRSYIRHNGLPGIAINARREIGSNVLMVMADLKKANQELNENILHPIGLHLVQTADKTEYISRSIDMVQFNLLVGGAFAIIILLLFLRSIRGTLVVALAIPISVIGSFLIITLMGRTINVIMLAGMAFAVGMVVDASIIVLENIHRHRQMGKDSHDSAMDGTNEVWGAILASTLTTLAVFIPILFIEDEVGQMFRDIAVAISSAVTLSMIVSILVIPALSKKLLRFNIGTQSTESTAGYFGFKNLFGIVALGQAFNNMVIAILKTLFLSKIAQATIVLVLTSIPIAAAWFLLPKSEYLPEGDQNVILGIMIPPQGYNIDEMHRIGNDMEKQYKAYWEAEPGSKEEAALNGPAVRNFLFIGSQGRLFVIVKARDPERAKELIPILKKELDKVPGMIAVIRQLSLFSSAFRGSRGIELNFSGSDMVKLTEIARSAFFKTKKLMPEAQIRPKPGIELGQPQLKIEPRWKEFGELGLDVSEFGYAVAALIDGVYADEVYLDPEKIEAPYLPRDGIDLTLRSREKDIRQTQDIGRMMVHTPNNFSIPLNSIAVVKQIVRSEEIHHLERKRSITLEILPKSDIALEEAIDLVRKEIIQPLIDDGTLSGPYSANLTGNADKLEKTRDAMSGNFVMAVIITYLLLAILFQHWGFPLIIMLSVPMAAAGGVFGLAILNNFVQQPLDVLTMLGFIILIGVVVNNAILIIHQSLTYIRVNQMAVQEAILESVRIRIRPIFMSSFTSIFGLLPLVVIPGAGTEIYRGTGVVILSGLLVSALFTLILIPCLLNLSFFTSKKQTTYSTPATITST